MLRTHLAAVWSSLLALGSLGKVLCLPPLRKTKNSGLNSENWFNVRLFCKPIIYLDMISSLAKKTKSSVHRNTTNSSTLAMAGQSELIALSEIQELYCTRSCNRSNRSSEGRSSRSVLVVQS